MGGSLCNHRVVVCNIYKHDVTPTFDEDHCLPSPIQQYDVKVPNKYCCYIYLPTVR